MFFNRKKSKKVVNDECTPEITSNTADNSDDMVAYMLSERYIHQLDVYCADNGLNIQKVFYSVDEARIAMLTESRPTRLIIIESGLGKFISTNIRREIVDLIGICNGIDKKVAIFYTNSLLKAEVMKTTGKIGKVVQWYKYINTITFIKEILKLNECYLQGNINRDIDIENIGLNYIGREQSEEHHMENHGTIDIIEEMWENPLTEELPSFKILI